MGVNGVLLFWMNGSNDHLTDCRGELSCSPSKALSLSMTKRGPWSPVERALSESGAAPSGAPLQTHPPQAAKERVMAVPFCDGTCSCWCLGLVMWGTDP